MSNMAKVWMRKPNQNIIITDTLLKHIKKCLEDPSNRKVSVYLQQKQFSLYDYKNENILTPYCASKKDGNIGCLSYCSPPTIISYNLFEDKENTKKIIAPKMSRNDSDRREHLDLIDSFIKKIRVSKKTNSIFSPATLNCYIKIVIEFLCNFDIMYKTSNNQSHLALNKNDPVLFYTLTNGTNLNAKKTKYSDVLAIKKLTSLFLKEELPGILLECLSEIDLEIKSKDSDTRQQIISQRNRMLLNRIEFRLAQNKSFEEILKFFFDDDSYVFDFFNNTLTQYLSRDKSKENSVIKSTKDNEKLLKEIIKI